MKTTYSTQWGNDEITITADFAQASSPVISDMLCGRQVADFRHSPRRAMMAALEAAAEADGLATDDDEITEETADAINDALNRMTTALPECEDAPAAQKEAL